MKAPAAPPGRGGFLASAPLVPLLVMLPLSAVYLSRGTQTVVYMSLAVAIAVAFIEARRGWQPRPLARIASGTPPPWLALAAGLLCWGASSALWAADPGAALERSGKLAASALAGYVLYRLLPPLSRRWHGEAMLAAVALAALVASFEIGTEAGFRQAVYGTLLALMNRTAEVLVFLIWPAMALAVGTRAHHWRWPALGVVAVAAFLSHSQSAELAVVTGALVLVVAYLSLRAAIVALAAGTVATVAAMPLIVTWMNAYLPEPLVRLASSGDLRLLIWARLAELAGERPVAGWGLEMSRGVTVEVPNIEERLGMPVFEVFHPHNAPLQIWMELGAIGAALLAAAAAALVLSIRRLPAVRQPYACAAFACAFAFSLTSHSLWQTWLFNLMIAVVLLFTLRGEPGGGPAR